MLKVLVAVNKVFAWDWLIGSSPVHDPCLHTYSRNVNVICAKVKGGVLYILVHMNFYEYSQTFSPSLVTAVKKGVYWF